MTKLEFESEWKQAVAEGRAAGIAVVPVCHKSPRNIVTWSYVDIEFEPWVKKLGIWYLGNTSQASPPKTVVRLNRLSASGGFYQVNILLNRWIWLLSISSIEERNLYMQDLGALWAELSKIQKIRWFGNPLDCRLQNLDGILSDRASAKRSIHGGIPAQDPLRLYGTPSMDRADPFNELATELQDAAPEIIQQVTSTKLSTAEELKLAARERRTQPQLDRLFEEMFKPATTREDGRKEVGLTVEEYQAKITGSGVPLPPELLSFTGSEAGADDLAEVQRLSAEANISGESR